jgi:hypothetical protein
LGITLQIGFDRFSRVSQNLKSRRAMFFVDGLSLPVRAESKQITAVRRSRQCDRRQAREIVLGLVAKRCDPFCNQQQEDHAIEGGPQQAPGKAQC